MRELAENRLTDRAAAESDSMRTLLEARGKRIANAAGADDRQLVLIGLTITSPGAA